MAADLQPVRAGAQVVRVVNHPAREPEHLALELGQIGQAGIGHDAFGSLELSLEKARRVGEKRPWAQSGENAQESRLSG